MHWNIGQTITINVATDQSNVKSKCIFGKQTSSLGFFLSKSSPLSSTVLFTIGMEIIIFMIHKADLALQKKSFYAYLT